MLYYKEKIIDGETFYKTSPEGEWVLVPNKKLTTRIFRLQIDVQRLTHKLETAQKRVHEPI